VNTVGHEFPFVRYSSKQLWNAVAFVSSHTCGD
jgi:hypothetical protein